MRNAGWQVETGGSGLVGCDAVPMDSLVGDALHVRGDVGRKVNNALTITFTAGPDQPPIAVGVQGKGDGVGGKLGVLFGFKNGGPGIHVLSRADGQPDGLAIEVESREQEPTLFRGPGSATLGEAVRGDASTVHGPDGAVVFTVVASPSGAVVPEGSKLPDVFRTDLVDAAGATFAGLDVMRTAAGWSLGRDLVDDVLWFGRAGQPLKIPIAGTALTFHRPPTALEGNLALAVCVDVALGIRPYIAAMN